MQLSIGREGILPQGKTGTAGGSSGGSEAATVLQAQQAWKESGGRRAAFCPICRTRGCAHLEKLDFEIKLQQGQMLKREIFGASPPNIFVGYSGYPDVQLGPLVSIAADADARAYDDPRAWYGSSLSEIVKFRSMLARGRKRQSVKEDSRELSDMQDVVLSQKTVDLEVRFKKALRFSLSFSALMQPMGPSADMEKMTVAGNPVIPRKVDSLMQENLTTREAVGELLDKDFEYYYLQKLLSAGVFGEHAARKVVPTRWSITAMDKMVADNYIADIKVMPEVSETLLYFNEYLFNRFHILVTPGTWEFEQFEAWQKGTAWHVGDAEWEAVNEWEPYEGRSDYAEKEGGGYYAGRFGAAEGLAKKLKRQGKVTIIREIGKEYNLPVGVWEVRENARRAFDKPPLKFATPEEAKAYLKARLAYPVERYWNESRILAQKRLTAF